MARLVLIEPALAEIGGHHSSETIRLGQAAEAAGFDVVLATDHQFRPANRLPESWEVHPAFGRRPPAAGARFNNQIPAELLRHCRRPARGFLRRWLPAWRSSRRSAVRIRIVADAVRCLVQRLPLSNGDVVLLPTTTEYELLGLALGLTESPSTAANADWHLQFHHPILTGRPPDYAYQCDRLKSLRQLFTWVLERMTGFRLNFHTPTDLLADQYNRLGVGQFRTLPIPIDACFSAPPVPRLSGPLNITCAGGVRREKNQHRVSRVVAALRQNPRMKDQVTITVQARDRLRLPSTSPRNTILVRVVPHPLSPGDYLELIRGADVGLLLHAGDRYFARYSGVFGEFLAAGVPVVVPAGCWMADQIAEPTYRYIDELLHSKPPCTVLAGEAVWERLSRRFRPETPGSVIFARRRAPAVGTIQVPPAAADLIVAFHMLASLGTYVRLRTEQFDNWGRRIGVTATVLSPRVGPGAVSALQRLQPGTRRVQLTWQNAYHDDPVRMANVRLHFLAPSGSGPAVHAPMGAVGLAADNIDQVPRILQNIVEHYEHYRRNAATFAHGWARDHHPARTLSVLLAGENRGSPAAPTTPVGIGTRRVHSPTWR